WRKHSTASVSRFASGFDFVAAAFRRGNLSFQFVSRDAAAHQSLGFASAFDFVAAAFRRAGLSFQCVSSNAAVHGYLVLVLERAFYFLAGGFFCPEGSEGQAGV